MPQKQKQEKRVDEHALFFALKIFFPLALALIVALGIDIYHAVTAIGQIYGGSV